MPRHHKQRRSSRACGNALFRSYFCEPLEIRCLLAGDPVLVLIESIGDDEVTAMENGGYLWENPGETPFNPHHNGSPAPSTSDGDDANTLPGDYFGWNFLTNGARFTPDATVFGHGSAITRYVLEAPLPKPCAST
jgi:hypothetical protein